MSAAIVKRKAKPRIASLREKAGLTQLELSRRVGVTESTIQNWESGRTGTDHIERVIKFCQALNCTVEELIEYISEPAEQLASESSTLTEIQTLLGTQDQAQETVIDPRVVEAAKQEVGVRE
jgi:transcriptional regulator with XRE-family HTH domain